MPDTRERLLCFEYLSRGSLKDHVSVASRGLQWRARYQIIRGICEGVQYLHRNNIVHSELRPTKVLLDDNMVPKIAYFCLSRCLVEHQCRAITPNRIESMGYMAPEAFAGFVTFMSDIYSLGMIIAEIRTGCKDIEKKNVRIIYTTLPSLLQYHILFSLGRTSIVVQSKIVSDEVKLYMFSEFQVNSNIS